MKASRFEFGEELIRMSDKYKDFVVCNPDTQSCGLEKFNDVNPDHAFMFGIAEQNLVNAAAGVASCGNKVYVSTFAVFLTMRACEQIRHFICYPELDVTLLGCHTGLQIGQDGGTHTALEDVGIMRSMANMSIIQPADGYAARAMARFTLDYHKPLYVRLHRSEVPVVYDETYEFVFGKGTIVRDYGNDIGIVSTGAMVYRAVTVAEQLLKKGIRAKVIDMSTIKPIDDELLKEIALLTGKIVTIEDHNIFGGLGSAVAESLCKHHPCRMLMLGVNDKYGESGMPEELYELHGLTPAQMVADIEAFYKA